jgi:2-dehydro-3-deoxyphosphogluconate aldolase/(4S)-4-hydroxy-2-oxoglutarate aldolase
VFPGALTPNEIYRAWSLGATMVKVFPANVYGPSYFADVKAPLGHIELLACGGVTVDTIGH